FTVTLSAATVEEQRFSIDLLDGTAGSSDYNAVLQNATFDSADVSYDSNTQELVVKAGVTSFNIGVQTTQDTTVEGDESFTLNVGGKSANAVIADDDVEHVVSITGGGNVTEGGVADFVVSLDREASEDVTVTLALNHGETEESDITGLQYQNAVGAWLDISESGQVIIPKGEQFVSVRAVTENDDVYEEDETFTVSIVDGGEAQVSETNQTANANIVDDENPPTVSISDGSDITEGEQAQFLISLDRAATEDIDVTFTISGDIDTADYTAPITQTLTISAGDTSIPLNIQTVDDSLFENIEEMVITITEVNGADATINANRGTLFIADNDAQHVASIVGGGDVTEGGVADFVVSLDRDASEDVTVTLALNHGETEESDIAGLQYQNESGSWVDLPESGQVTIPQGEKFVSVRAVTANDDVYEGDENFSIAIVDGGDALVSDGQNVAAANIVDDENPPVVSISDGTDIAEGEVAGFVISLDHAATEDVQVTFTIGGDVDAGDYTAPITQTMTIAAGETSMPLNIQTIDDDLFESTEEIVVTITDVSGADATINANRGTLLISDNDTPSEITVEQGDSASGAVTEDVDTDTEVEGVQLVLNGTLTVTDQDGDGAFNTTSSFSGTNNAGGVQLGTLTIDATGNWTYEVDNDDATVQALGEGESIVETYTVSTADSNDTQTITITINGTNDGPVAVDDTASTSEDTVVTIDVLANDTDLDGDTLTITEASVPAEQGTVAIVDGKVQFTPADNFNGDATISYTITDGTATDSAEVTVTVDAV
ncbi:Ig-like domain-containing protein, partial [Marinomonas atlantica]|uniref:Ig-like domain-containing protein n=1 Tax=Marinomonas atlantica TaxID=1806668 RepID=UPI0012E74247